MTAVAGYAKAVVALLIAGLGALATALADDVVTQAEWVAVALAAATALGGVWAIPNKTGSTADALDQSMQLDDGHGAPDMLVWLLVVVILVLVLVRLL